MQRRALQRAGLRSPAATPPPRPDLPVFRTGETPQGRLPAPTPGAGGKWGAGAVSSRSHRQPLSRSGQQAPRGEDHAPCPEDRGPGAGESFPGQQAECSEPGVSFCLVFRTSHQSNDSTRVASGMEMFKLGVRTELYSMVIASCDWRLNTHKKVGSAFSLVTSLGLVPLFPLVSVP